MSAFIQAENLSLRVPLFVQNERQTTSWGKLLISALLDPPRREFRLLLNDISFRVEEGERVAILGRNGAGKSTLLRALNGVYTPTTGSVSSKGTCQSLLNTSLGFNNEATVKENIFLRANAMGLPPAMVGGMIKPILTFAGLSAKANHRLKTLSSGQRMRLGFAISTEVQHDIMLLDEWVGTGDSEFLTRAKERMVNRMGGSKIVMLASHNFSLLRSVCNKGMVLEQGRVIFYGDLIEAISAYQEIASTPPAEGAEGSVEQPLLGCVDHVSINGTAVSIKGWAVNEAGLPPKFVRLVTAYGEMRVKASDFHSRPDVAAAMGLLGDKCGFECVIELSSEQGLDALGGIIEVYGGDTPSANVGPLPLQGTARNLVERALNR